MVQGERRPIPNLYTRTRSCGDVGESRNATIGHSQPWHRLQEANTSGKTPTQKFRNSCLRWRLWMKVSPTSSNPRLRVRRFIRPKTGLQVLMHGRLAEAYINISLAHGSPAIMTCSSHASALKRHRSPSPSFDQDLRVPPLNPE
jgi:hypothetical protein